MVKHLSEFYSFFKKDRIFPFTEIIGAHETTEVSDRRFKDVEALNARNSEVDFSEISNGNGEVLMQVHDVESVKRINQSRTPTPEMVLVTSRDGLHFVVEPGILPIALP